MAARFLQTTKSIKGDDFKGLGSTIVAALAFNSVTQQGLNPVVTAPDSRDVRDSTTVPNSARREVDAFHRSAQTINTAVRPRPRGSGCKQGLIPRRERIEYNPVTKAHVPVSTDLVPLDLHDADQVFEPPSAASRNLVATASVQDNASVAHGEASQQETSVQLDSAAVVGPLEFLDHSHIVEAFQASNIHPFLQYDKEANASFSGLIEDIAGLVKDEKIDRALEVIKTQFPSGSFKQHLFSHLRQKMLRLAGQNKDIINAACESDPLLRAYAIGLKRWCASIFDATICRLEFAFECVYYLTQQAPKTNEVHLRPNIDSRFKVMQAEIFEACNWFKGYHAAATKYSDAVNNLKKKMSSNGREVWNSYKTTFGLHSKDVKKSFPRKSRAVSLLKDAHFISWFLRVCKPATFLHQRLDVVKAIAAFDDIFWLADVLENLRVSDAALGAYNQYREGLATKKFYAVFKPPMPVYVEK